jgi:hypothetical protein
LPTIPLLAWALAPGFVAAGALLGVIPIIIHILNRRRFKVVRWAAMEYLLAAMRKNRRRIQFEQLLLLATRCLLLALLGLALARPLACQDSSMAALAGQRSGLHIFVIDNSYSMAHDAAEPGKTQLEVARDLARRQIERLTAGSESVAIITAAKVPPLDATPGRTPPLPAPGEPPVAIRPVLEPTFDLRGAAEAAERIEQTFLATDMPGALQAAVEVARQDKQPLKFLYILSDCTRAAWERPEVSRALEQLGPVLAATFQGRIRLHNLGVPDQWNHAILDLRPDGGLVTPTFHTDFLADVRGYGNTPETTIQWRWDDVPLPDSGRILPDLGTAPLRQTKVQVNQGGPHVLAAVLGNNDRVHADNTRYRIVEVAAALRVLIVEGARGAGALAGSGAYLDLSLAPRKERDPGGHLRSSTYVLPEVISDLELSSRVLGDYRALILTSVPSLSGPQADQVAKYVAAGGTLMLFMGDQVQPDAYNNILLPRKLLPGKLLTRKSTPADGKAFGFDFNPNGPLHPSLAVFKGESRTGLDTAQIFTYYQIEAPADAVVLRYVPDPKTGVSDPAITMHAVGDGRVVFFSTTANSDWNALPQKPAYIPLIHELLANAVDVGDRWMNLQTGQCLEVPPTLRITALPALLDPARRPVPLEPVGLPDGQTLYRSKPLAKPGLYQLSLGARTVPIAVNVPAAEEADLRALPGDAIAKALGDIEMQLLGAAAPDSGMASQDKVDFGWAIMLVVLALAGAECFMAMHFGHHRRTATASAAAAAAPEG